MKLIRVLKFINWPPSSGWVFVPYSVLKMIFLLFLLVGVEGLDYPNNMSRMLSNVTFLFRPINTNADLQKINILFYFPLVVSYQLTLKSVVCYILNPLEVVRRLV